MRGDYSPRTKAGSIYFRSEDGKRDYVFVDAVCSCRRGKECLEMRDWEIVIVGTLTDVGSDGPSEGTQACAHFFKPYEFKTYGKGGWRKIAFEEVPASWQAFLKRSGLDAAIKHGKEFRGTAR